MRAQEVFDRLLAKYGPQRWWPGDSPLEIMCGAVLVQNTNWRNVERALANLREEGLLDARRIAACDLAELAELIRPAGYYQVKAKRLSNLARYLAERCDGDLTALQAVGTAQLREELLQVNGVGPETADSILLYALGRPQFVVDTYSHRVLARHGWLGYDADYEELQSWFTGQLPEDAPLFNEFHALLVAVGKAHCGKTPQCAGCPLADLLPSSGVQEPW